MKIGIVTKPALLDARDTLAEIASWLEANGVEAVWSPEAADLLPDVAGSRGVLARQDIPHSVDLVLVLGGDGTLLAMADRIAAASRDIPILGVNFGSLGFLTEITRPELFDSLAAVVGGGADHDLRMMLRARVGTDTFVALNDVVVTRHALSRMVEVSVWVGEQFVTTVKADGLIIATPTGSTAYNLSAAGPILFPTKDAVVLTPICSHTLTNRPIVLPASTGLEVTLLSESPDVILSVDGQPGPPMAAGDVVHVRQGGARIRLIRDPRKSYFEVLRTKLKWGER